MEKQEKICYNASVLKEEIEVLKNLSAKFFLISHDERFIYPKEEIIAELRMKLRRRKLTILILVLLLLLCLAALTLVLITPPQEGILSWLQPRAELLP